MADYGGFLFLIDEPERAAIVVDQIRTRGSFTDVISAPDWHPRQAEIFLLCIREPSISHAALVRRGRIVATRKVSIRFTDLVSFVAPIPLADIENQLTGPLRRYFLRSSSGSGVRVPPATWAQLLEIIKRIDPTASPALADLEGLRARGIGVPRTNGDRIVAEERDAVNLALRIAGFPEQVLLAWNYSKTAEPAPFIQGLQRTFLREDPMIQHDAAVFGDWTQLEKYQIGAAEFVNGAGQRFTIMNVNRHSVEESLGVDLVYYSHSYRSYVLVQYKRMVSEGSILGYRPIDPSYRAELSRMRTFMTKFPDDGTTAEPADYRLHPGFFFFKLCPAELLDPRSTDMIRGMYFPLDYWEILDESPQILGKGGGKCITYDNSGRHFSNSEFIPLVQSGWIGSRTLTSDAITEYVNQALNADRSVMLAAKSSTPS